MKSVKDWDEDYLNELIKLAEKESLTLEYKASAALKNSDKEKNDLAKDVSALANSAGGILVYGMLEKDKHVPTAIDVGVDRNAITKEWLESVIKGHIQPAVGDLIIKQIELTSKGADKVAYAIEIPQATSRAPHQANDHRYYKRSNFESKPMEDYEVRDAMRRSIDYGRQYGAAWDLNMEVNRLLSAADERARLDGYPFLRRDRLLIGVSNALRSSGNAMILLEKPIREDVAALISIVDAYNSVVETVDPGQGENARMSERLRSRLAEIRSVGQRISTALTTVLQKEP